MRAGGAVVQLPHDATDRTGVSQKGDLVEEGSPWPCHSQLHEDLIEVFCDMLLSAVVDGGDDIEPKVEGEHR